MDLAVRSLITACRANIHCRNGQLYKMSSLQLQIGDVIHADADGKVTVKRALVLPQSIPVAVKQQIFASPLEANSALREALNMALLNHPNIVSILDCFIGVLPSGDISVSIVSELLENDLSKQVKDRQRAHRPWSEEELWGIFTKLISALSCAERRGVSHRDIKPENIFTGQELVKLGDFGSSAHFVEDRMRKTLQGSPLFLSPELKRAYIRKLSTGRSDVQYDPVKSDVYSLAVTMVYLALLSPPEALTSIESLEVSTARVLASLTAYPSLSTWLSPMLAVEPDDRPTFSVLEDSILGSCQPQCEVVSERRCLQCRQEILDQSWTTNVPEFLKPYRGFFEVCCSQPCLEARANAFPSTFCAICGFSIEGGIGVCLMPCGHRYHHTCRKALPASSPHCANDCPQCYPDTKLRDVSIDLVANGWSEMSLAGIPSYIAFPRAEVPARGQYPIA